MVSKKGFTQQALKLAKHENIGCVSLLPNDPDQAGFSIGEMWYGVIRRWSEIRLNVHFAIDPAPILTFDSGEVYWQGKPVVNWFKKELITKYCEETNEREHGIELKFDEKRNIEIEGKEYPVTGITCIATRVCRKKRKWVNWSGDAFYDWHTGQITIAAKGTLVGSAVESDISLWPDYNGDIPERGETAAINFIRIIFYDTQKWDADRDNEVPDLHEL